VAASAKAVANRLLDLAARDGKKIDPLQMQKLLYLAEGWTLSVTGESLFRDPIEAWDYGPVVPGIYQALRNYGSRSITAPLAEIEGGEIEPAVGYFTPAQERIIGEVWAGFGDWSGPQLINLTHKPGSPWHKVFTSNSAERNGRINRLDIKDWFDDLADSADGDTQAA
jgi:uncharacterized phage-associated protein